MIYIYRILLVFTATLIGSYSFGQCSTPITTFPYIEDFELSPGWTTGGPANSAGVVLNDWAWGTPSKPVITGAGSGVKCWVTAGLTGSNYLNGERSYIKSPCFNFTGLAHPYVAFKIFWESEYKYDGSNLQYSTDGGSTWTNVGAYGDPVDCLNDNWYNYSNVTHIGQFSTGGTTYYSLSSTKEGWCGNVQSTSGGCQGGHGSNGWVVAKHCMSYLAGLPSVIFRVTFGAGTTCNAFDGIAIDSFSISEAPAVVPTFTVSCGGGNQMNFIGSSNLCNNTYSWNFGDAASGGSNTSTAASPSHTFSGAGAYTVTLTATNACAGSGSHTLQVVVPAVTATAINPLCPGGTGKVYATAAGVGTTYHWSTVPAQNTDTAMVTTSSNYTVTATFASGCTATATATATIPAPLAIAPVVSLDTCTAGHGKIQITVSGGTANYNYAWSNGAGNVTTVSNLLGGHSYIVTVTDAHGCKDSSTFNITNVSSFSVTDSAERDATCAGKLDGRIIIIAHGGSLPYQYSWSPNVSTAALDTLLAMGSYTVSVTDHSGCAGTVTFTIGQPTALSILPTITPDTCTAGHGKVQIAVSGGTTNYNYAWSNGAGNVTTATNLFGGHSYIVTVTDAHGCIDSGTFNMSNVSSFSLRDSVISGVSCPGNSDGRAIVIATGGLPPYSYSWLPNVSTAALDTLLAMGSYTVSVTDHSGCVAAVSFSIADASTLVVDIGDDTTICVGNKVRLHTWIPGASYQWSTGSTDSFVVVTAPATNPLIVRVTKGNCTVADTVMVYTDSIIGFDLTASKMTICPTMPDTVSLTAMGKSNTPTAVAVFTWSTGFSDSAANTSAVQVHHSGSYTVTVEDDICTVTKSLTIADGPCDTACIGEYKTPNAFTPNGDTKNELFRVRYKCSLYNFSMRIYNRWGELIFETTDPNSGWDGTYKGIAQPEEVYMWNCCVAGTAGAGVKCTTGTLSLFR